MSLRSAHSDERALAFNDADALSVLTVPIKRPELSRADLLKGFSSRAAFVTSGVSVLLDHGRTSEEAMPILLHSLPNLVCTIIATLATRRSLCIQILTKNQITPLALADELQRFVSPSMIKLIKDYDEPFISANSAQRAARLSRGLKQVAQNHKHALLLNRYLKLARVSSEGIILLPPNSPTILFLLAGNYYPFVFKQPGQVQCARPGETSGLDLKYTEFLVNTSVLGCDSTILERLASYIETRFNANAESLTSRSAAELDALLCKYAKKASKEGNDRIVARKQAFSESIRDIKRSTVQFCQSSWSSTNQTATPAVAESVTENINLLEQRLRAAGVIK